MHPMNRRNLLTGLATVPALTSTVLTSDLPTICGMDDETREKLKDWPNLGRYAADNEALLASGQPTDIVFMGDSITEGWPDKRPAFFHQGRVCRGIGGQTTPQMVLRMMADVVALKPKLVHIMAGTNDIAGNTGPMSAEQTIDNIHSMVVLAKSNDVGVLLSSIPPAASFPWRSGLNTVQAIGQLNNMLFRLAKLLNVHFVDYTAALSDNAGGMKNGFAYDGVHPDIKGYQAMEEVLEPIISAVGPRKHSVNLPR